MSLGDYFAYLIVAGFMIGAPTLVWWLMFSFVEAYWKQKSDEVTIFTGFISLISWIVAIIGIIGMYLLK